MPCQNQCRYQSLPQHQLNILLNKRQHALQETHSQPVQSFPRANVKVCLENRGVAEWNAHPQLPLDQRPVPYNTPNSTDCSNLSPTELQFLQSHHRDTYLTHPGDTGTGTGHSVEPNQGCHLTPPFQIFKDTPSYIGSQVWNVSTRLT